jgi:hypothetical protein
LHKIFFTITTFGRLFVVLLFTGYISSSQPVHTPFATTAFVIPSPTLAIVPFPNALVLNEYSCFGSGNGQGSATVCRYEIRPHYNWTSPSWNSPREQAAASQLLELQNGFNRQKPRERNTSQNQPVITIAYI